jgi:hypothetical protein
VQRERHLRFARERWVAAGEDQAQPIVGNVRRIASIALLRATEISQPSG